MRVPEISLVNGLHAQNKHDLCRTISIQNDIDILNTFQLTQFHLWWCQVCRAWEFVGIVLINNGMCTLYHVDGKSTAIMNIFTGGLSLFINFVNLVQGNYYAAGTGLLFCFTYLFVTLSKFLKASPIPFAWFSTFVAVNALIFGTIEGFTGSTALGITPDLRWAGIWYLWAILWGTAFVEDICGKKLGKFVPYLQVFEGVVTAWIPGVMMLLQIW